MRLIDADMLDCELRDAFDLPAGVLPLQDDRRESIQALNLLCAAPTIIPGNDTCEQRSPMYLIDKQLAPLEIIKRLRMSAKMTRHYIGSKPRLLDDEAADCIEQLLKEDRINDNTRT